MPIFHSISRCLLLGALLLSACEEQPGTSQTGYDHDLRGFRLDAGEDLGATADLGERAGDLGVDIGADGGQAGLPDSGADAGTNAGMDLGLDAGPPNDAGALDLGQDAGAPDLGHDAGFICGDGQLDPGETCDDGQITAECDRLTDGGDGRCVEPGTCSPGYIFSNGCIPSQLELHVHIDVSNTCNMTVSPTTLTVPAGQQVNIDWHNHSVDYPVDVWMSYGGGFTDLPQGQTWDEPIPHCSIQSPHQEWADISTACSSFRFIIDCQ